MESLEALLRAAEQAHGHLCAGQVLGVRMAMLGCERLGIDEPRGRDRKRLVTFVEIDRCATDAIGVVTGCRLGKRALKFRDWGKMAATFIDLADGRALRLAATETSRQRAAELYPDIDYRNRQQMLAYREMDPGDLFTEQWVRVALEAREFPGYKAARTTCAECGESISYDRWVVRESDFLCQGCAHPAERYYQPFDSQDSPAGAAAATMPRCECP